MARIKRKRMGHHPGQARPLTHIGYGDALPHSLIIALNNIPDLHNSPDGDVPSNGSTVEPSPKRRKAATTSQACVEVACASLSLTRRCEGEHPDFVIHRQDVGSYLSVSFYKESLYLRGLQKGPKTGHAALTIAVKPTERTRDVDKIMQASTRHRPTDRTGAIWTNVDMTVIKQADSIRLDFTFSLYWNTTDSPYTDFNSTPNRAISQQLIDLFFPARKNRGAPTAWSPMDFYEAAHVPPKEDHSSPDLEIPGLEAHLYPYQKRTLQWLLSREGVRWSGAGQELEQESNHQMSPCDAAFRPVQDAHGNEVFVSDVFQAITKDISPFRVAESALRGGILAEEMGLGKTLEILALILLNRRLPPGEDKTMGDATILRSEATLIVTPASLRQQWLSEISRHAPGLRVNHYKGRKFIDMDEGEAVRELAGYDIVVTTYAVLSAELHFAFDPPDRSRRHERAYERPKSPLVQISWWRVCLDEAQMVENGYSQAAVVSRVIPRINAWGITGTPVKDNIKDLFGLLLFLRYEPYCSNAPIWDKLIRDQKPLFQQLFRSVSVRHTKALVRDELLLPPQKRYVISMPFTAIEEQHYQSLFSEMAEACSLDTFGVPTVDEWKQEEHEEDMRMWLNRLRQSVLHPEVGIHNRRALGPGRRPMKTIDEVLDAMLDQSEASLRADERAYLNNKLTRGQLYENGPRVKEALSLWEDVRRQATRLVSDARVALRSAVQEQKGLQPARKPSGDNGDGDRDGHKSSDNDSDPVSDGELGEEEFRGQVGECRRRLRYALEMLHKSIFFCASAYFQIKDNQDLTPPDSDEFRRLQKLEDDSYEEAKVVRREILRESQRKATKYMSKLARKASEQSFAEVPELVMAQEKGIETGQVVENLQSLYGRLNEQANVIDEWRENVVQLLLKPLLDEEDGIETTGEELADSAKTQDQMMVHVQALQAAIADRQDALSGQQNELIKHETQTSIRLAKEDGGPDPKKLLELLEVRAQINPKVDGTSMRAAISDFRGIASKHSREAPPGSRPRLEHDIASRHLTAVQSALAKQNKASLALESEYEYFKMAMNARLEFYRQLQAVSDSVLPYDGVKTDEAIAGLIAAEDNLRRKLSSTEAKHRYLLNLKENGSRSNEPRMCVICQTHFITGVLTVCGHQFCKECMSTWFKAHHNCPVCKKVLTLSMLHDIIIKPKELRIQSDAAHDASPHQSQTSPTKHGQSSKQTMIYSEFNAEKLEEIKNVELNGPSFTTKVDTLVQHILWLRESDPGAKSIVFSQYRDFLGVLRSAFQRFRIGFASIDDPEGTARFKEDPAAECFLLHARAHSSGLNLINASHVFLCEPLLNTALELQAIARVDRIGQQHETTVWLYLISGTIEESIYNMSVQRRMEHMGKGKRGKSKKTSSPEILDASIEEANTLELENAALSKLMSKDKTAGEMVDKSDLWECLFGHIKAYSETGTGSRQDVRFQERAVKSWVAAEAAEVRRT